MAFDSEIAWCHHTQNAWIGCTKKGPDCLNCYAENLMDKRFGRVRWGPNGTRQRTSLSNWRKPYQWNRLAEKHGTRFLVFGDSLNDILEDRPELAQWRAEYCQMMEETQYLTWLLLTKRPENWELLPSKWFPFPPKNVWFGLSAGDQATYDERAGTFIDYFDQFPVKFLSVEPHIGPLTIGPTDMAFWDWIVDGGESDQAKPGRYYNPEWGLDLLRECRATNTPFFMKQMGSAWAKSHVIRAGDTPHDLGDRAGSNPLWWPGDFLVREFPEQIVPFLESAREVLDAKRKRRKSKPIRSGVGIRHGTGSDAIYPLNES